MDDTGWQMYNGALAEIGELKDRIAELEAQLAAHHHECARCRSVQPCQPSGYEWDWYCEDEEACEARYRAIPRPIRAPSPDQWGLGETFKQLYEKKLLENARRQLSFTPGKRIEVRKAGEGDGE